MTTTDQDPNGVLKVLEQIYAGLAANDADAYVAGYAPDAYVCTPGVFLPDREALRATMAGHFEGPLKGSRGVYEVKSLRFLGADAAVVLTKAGIVLAGDTQADDFQDTWVFGRTDGRWEVRAFHTCPA